MDWSGPRGRIFWIIVGVVLVFGMALAARNSPPAPAPASAPANPAEAPAFAGDLEEVGQGMFSGLADPASTPESLELAARAQCAGLAACNVYLWAREADRARAMPMLDREVAARVFVYDLNRATGMERTLRDCTRWPAPADMCL